tara:strand:- start:123 stop:311 length:189 start_codon:yes stop_codon:yes gene_type:complete
MEHSLLEFVYFPHCSVCGAHIEAAALLWAECWLAIDKATSTETSANIAEPKLTNFKLIEMLY